MSDIDRTSRVYRAAAQETPGEFADVPVADLGSGEVLIRTTYSCINYKDALAATGRGRVVRRFPLVLGIDAAGVVEESSDARHRVGDRVAVTAFRMAEDHDGGYSEYVRVPADWPVRLPEGLSDRDAMAYGTAGVTAALAIQRLQDHGLAPGNGPVAVSGASGGSGCLAVSMLAGLGFEVSALTGKRDRHELLRRLGAAEVLDRPDTSGTRPLEKARWAGAVDCTGGDILAWLIRTADFDASVATFGNTAGNELHTSVLPFILRGVNVLGINGTWMNRGERERLWERLAADLRPAALDEIVRVEPFSTLPDHLEAFLDGSIVGRVVLDLSR